MSILSGPEIVMLVKRYKNFVLEEQALQFLPLIDIEPFDPRPTTEGGRVGPNSYDVSLGDRLLTYRSEGPMIPGVYPPSRSMLLDARKGNPTEEQVIPVGGTILLPGRLYLGSLVERVRCEGLVPYIDGRSSVGRLGISIHATAGRGDDGWNGHLTLEITCVHPVRIYAGMVIGQVTFHKLVGERMPYKGKYQNSVGPEASKMWQDNQKETSSE